MKALRRARHRWLRLRRDESGFGLMELVVASTVMMTALTSMAYVTTSAFGDIAMAKERQAANALLDEAIEQLRALPYDTVSLGMRTSDLAGDPRVIGSGTAGAPYRLATTNERIVHVSTNQVIAPLVPNVSSRTIDNKVYAVRVYLTHFQDNPGTGAVTATAYVDWTSSARNAGKPAFLRASTVIFSPAAASAGSGACLSTATHPFSGPCLEFFYASAAASGGTISITGDAPLSTVFGGTTTIVIPEASSTMQEEQTTSVQGQAKGPGMGTATGPAAAENVTTKADNDPASAGSVGNDGPRDAAAAYAGSASGVNSSSSTTLTMTGSTSTGAATASSVSTTGAADSHKCGNVDGSAFLNDGMPCGRSTAAMGSLTSSLGLGTLGITGQVIGTLKPLTISGLQSIAHTDRQLASTSGACAGTASTGCVRSTATRSIGSISIAGLPGLAADAALIKLDNFKATVTAEAGINAGAPTASVTSGTVSVWTPSALGGSFQTVTGLTLGSGATINVPPVTITDLINPGLTLTVSAQLRTGSSSTSSTTGTCMVSYSCRTRADSTMGSALVGTITYRFQLGSNVVTMTMTVDLGNLTASASYADPPSTA